MAGDAREGGHGLALVYLDIDGFKAVNETRGHLVGDRVLEVVAGCLEDVVADAGVAARVGGDEFAVLLSGMHDREAVLLIELVRAPSPTTPPRSRRRRPSPPASARSRPRATSSSAGSPAACAACAAPRCCTTR